MTKKIQIRFHGRGGQGTVTLADLTARSAFYNGYEVQGFPSFGVERRGAPVEAFVRISTEKILTREQIYSPDFLIIQDETLLKSEDIVLHGVKNKTVIIVNSNSQEIPAILSGKKVFLFPAETLAIKTIGKPFVNTILLGVLGVLSDLFDEDSMDRAIKEVIKKEVVDLNLQAMKEAVSETKKRFL